MTSPLTDNYKKRYVKPNLRVVTAKYDYIHVWLRKKYGRPAYCEGTSCAGVSKRFEWAKLKDKPYARNRDHFIRLCKSCHTKYDTTDYSRRRMSHNSYYANKTHCLRGHPLSGNNVYHQKKAPLRACRICRWARSKVRYYMLRGKTIKIEDVLKNLPPHHKAEIDRAIADITNNK